MAKYIIILACDTYCIEDPQFDQFRTDHFMMSNSPIHEIEADSATEALQLWDNEHGISDMIRDEVYRQSERPVEDIFSGLQIYVRRVSETGIDIENWQKKLINKAIKDVAKSEKEQQQEQKKLKEAEERATYQKLHAKYGSKNKKCESV